MVADELFTNAIYNAPHVSFAENGPGVARTHENGNTLSLMPARLFLGADSSRIIIGSEDSYGTLNPCHLLKRLKACYTEGTNVAMNWSVGGAGLGTYMIFRSALAYYAGIEQGKRTVVACSFAQGARRSENVRNIHFSIDRDT